jgi:D-lactate dehydrogenase
MVYWFNFGEGYSGVEHNSYHTTKYLKFILPNGASFNTENKEDYFKFEHDCPEIFETLKTIKKDIASDFDLKQKIKAKYLIKNTVGYGINSFIDFEHPLDIMAHLLIGAEGTLGFISEAVLQTIPDYPFKATALLYFKDIFETCKLINPLIELQLKAIEMMDNASLFAVKDLLGVTENFFEENPDLSALLVEFQAETEFEIESLIQKFIQEKNKLTGILNEVVFTQNPTEQAKLWKIRKGLFPAVGAVRKSGNTVILEDVAFPVARLGEAIFDLRRLFKKYGYDNAIIFGHAKDGNIHFVINQTFAEETQVNRYANFMQEVVKVVVSKYNGSLKAEHGTGRNMAPFVATEWGNEAYEIMKKIKNVIDPDNLLNPGVIINADEKAHLKNLKHLPTVENEIDKCIECGFCEPVCPSKNFTLSPRRRIVVRREIAKRKATRNTQEKKNLENLIQDFKFDGLDTCAVDGLCAVDCPVEINTGNLVKRLRKENHSKIANELAQHIAKNFSHYEFGLTFLLKIGKAINRTMGKKSMFKISNSIKKAIPNFPLWSYGLDSHIQKYKFETNKVDITANKETIIYFSTCVSRVLGGNNDKKSLQATVESIANKLNFQIKYPNQLNACCGQIFSSKGFTNAYQVLANQIIENLWVSTENGKLPILIDVSSCTQTILSSENLLSIENKLKFKQLKFWDTINFIDELVIPKVNVGLNVKKKKSVALHPVCSLQKLNLDEKFKQIAQYFSEDVFVPIASGCCGMAGDRGFIIPDFIKSSTLFESEEINLNRFDGYYSSAKTCEMAISQNTNQNYESILYLVDECLITL